MILKIAGGVNNKLGICSEMIGMAFDSLDPVQILSNSNVSKIIVLCQYEHAQNSKGQPIYAATHSGWQTN